MFRTALLRLWQYVTQGFVRSQADDQIDEAEEFRELYLHEMEETCRKLGLDFQIVEDESDIDPMNTTVLVGSLPEPLKLSTYARAEDFATLRGMDLPNPPPNISASPHFKKNLKLMAAYQEAVDAYRQRLND